MGKTGVLWELDQRTGAFRNAFDLGYQNIVDIHPLSKQGIWSPSASRRSTCRWTTARVPAA